MEKTKGKKVFSEKYRQRWKIEIIKKTLDMSNAIDWAKFEDVYYWYINWEWVGWRDDEMEAVGYMKWFLDWKETWHNEAREEVRKALWFPDCRECDSY